MKYTYKKEGLEKIRWNNESMKIKLSKTEWVRIGKTAGWIPQETDVDAKVFEASGIQFSWEKTRPSQQMFKYRLRVPSTQQVFERQVWCDSQDDFMKLIDVWRRKSSK